VGSAAVSGSRAAVLRQAGAPLSWTNAGAASVRGQSGFSIGCRLRASEEGSGYRAPASASGASNIEGNEGTRSSSPSDDEVGGWRCSRRRSAGGDGGTTLFRSVGSDEDGGNPANIAASGASN
jgi:hypothetical protein